MSPEAGLYVHVPFCEALCPYCDFAVNLGPEARRRRYVDLLLEEISIRGTPGAPFDTLYFGGGTPSLIPACELRRIVDELWHRGWLRSDSHLSLEANPEHVNPDVLAGFREAGISTLSLGVQSLDGETLRFLGRNHTPRQARDAVALARKAGFATVSMDLMYGIPGQTPADLQRELEEAISLAPDHLSCYQLTLHEKTLFGRRKQEGGLEEIPEETAARLFRLTHEILRDRGYEAYEVSNFARAPEHRSRHNQKYWTHAAYLGLGPSAHSFDGRSRAWNERSFFAWEKRILRGEIPEAGREDLTAEQRIAEKLMLGLRTTSGVDLVELEERFAIPLRVPNQALLERCFAEGLLFQEGRHLRPTLDGLAVADGLAGAFRIPRPASAEW
jgi:oxygen-independent coproporphyrinogen-3 oxidase